MEIIENILQAEEKANEIVKEANQKGKTLILQAKDKADELLQQSAQTCKKIFDENTQKIAVDSDKIATDATNVAQKSFDEIIAKTKDAFDKAQKNIINDFYKQ